MRSQCDRVARAKPLRATPFAPSRARQTIRQAENERSKELQLSTAGGNNAGTHPRVKVQSAGWVKIGSAPTYPGNREIPEGATEYYLYAGEAGRRQNYARRLHQRNGRYRRQIAEALDRYVRAYPKENAPPPASVAIRPMSGEGRETGTSFLELLGPIPKMRHVPGIRLELPSIHFGWESYHSSHNDFSGFSLPAPRLIQHLGLASKNREIDFYDSMGKSGTLSREAGDGWKGDRHSLLYVRADLLRRYLTATRQVLVWCNWGERDWLKKMEGHEVIRDPARQRIYQAHGHIHRSFSRWSAKDSKII